MPLILDELKANAPPPCCLVGVGLALSLFPSPSPFRERRMKRREAPEVLGTSLVGQSPAPAGEEAEGLGVVAPPLRRAPRCRGAAPPGAPSAGCGFPPPVPGRIFSTVSPANNPSDPLRRKAPPVGAAAGEAGMEDDMPVVGCMSSPRSGSPLSLALAVSIGFASPARWDGEPKAEKIVYGSNGKLHPHVGIIDGRIAVRRSRSNCTASPCG